MIYKHLKPGDIRQAGDEYRRNTRCDNGTVEDQTPNVWYPARLLGHAILSSDLIVQEFRRPCKTQ